MSGKKKSQAKVTNCMKEELLKWLCIKHALNFPMTRDMLRQKAQELLKHYDLTTFKCSESWITVFLKRYQFPTNLQDGPGPVFDDYQTWVGLIREILGQYTYENQYHLEELTLYTDFLPSPQLQSHEVADGPVDMSTLKVQLTTPAMHQTTLLLACNSTGTQKQKPLICGPYPVQEATKFSYIQSHDSKISDEILSAWLFVFNRQMAETGRRVILIMPRKRVNVLKLIRLTHVLTVFLPRNYPPELRPLRGDVALFLKMYYRKAYVQRLCDAAGGLWTPQEIVETLVKAWEELPRDSIVSRFQSTKFREDQSSLSMECSKWDSLKTGVNFERFVTFDDNLGETPGPLRDDLRFLTNVKRQFNVKALNAEREITGSDDHEVCEPQPSTSGLAGVENAPERPQDDFVGDSEEEETADFSSIPGIPIKTELGSEGISPGEIDRGSESLGAPGDAQNDSDFTNPVIRDLRDSGFQDGPSERSAVKRLFPETEEKSFDEGRTADSSESAAFDEFESTVEESLPLADAKDDTVESFGDSGVPDETDENLDRNLGSLETHLDEAGSDGRGMDVDCDAGEECPGIPGPEGAKGCEIGEEGEAAVLTPLVDARMEDATSPGVGIVDQFVGNDCGVSDGGGAMLNTSGEGTVISVKHFVDERVYFVSTVGELPEKDENETGTDGDVGDEPMDTREGSNPVNPEESADEITENLDSRGKIEKSEEHCTDLEELDENSTEFQEIERKLRELAEGHSETGGSEVTPSDREASVDKPGIAGLGQGSSEENSTPEACDPSEGPSGSAPMSLKQIPEDPEDLQAVFPMKILNSSPVTPFSSESALQEASRELEEKLRDLEANDPSRKTSFDDESSESELSSASVLRDLLSAKDFGETAAFPGGKFCLAFGDPEFRGGKRSRVDGGEGEPERKKVAKGNWAECFESVPAFGPYGSEEGEMKGGVCGGVEEISEEGN